MRFFRLRNVLLATGAVGAYVVYNFKLPEIQTKGEPYQVLPRASITDHPNINFMTKYPSKIGIIGGGIGGSITAKTLTQQGYDVEVLEKNSTFGGLWLQNYDGSGLQFHYGHYNIPDFPFPKDSPGYPRSSEVKNFIESYVNHFKISKYFQFNTSVSSIKKNPDDSWTVITNKGEKTYDFLILCTGPYNKPCIPAFTNRSEFKGKVIHSSEFINAESLCKGKKVLVIGSGKSAFDIIGQAHKYGGQVQAVQREAHWFVSPELKILGLNRGYFTGSRFAGLFLDPFYADSENLSFSSKFFGLLGNFYWKFIETRLEKGVPGDLLPAAELKKEKHFRGGARDDAVFNLVAQGAVKIHRGSVDGFYPDGVVVKGRRIPADVVVLATGFERELFGFKADNDGLWMYRNTIIPGVKNFAVVGIINTYCNPLYTNMQAVWLSEVLRGRVRLPGDFAMSEDVIRRRNYTRGVINGEGTISFSWFPIPQIDQFLRDMGLPTTRKKNLLDYWFDPIKPEDYSEVITHRS
jgi:dimethylaniline monooxygenase (N-oxide forming)